jgi:hypothetical protein
VAENLAVGKLVGKPPHTIKKGHLERDWSPEYTYPSPPVFEAQPDLFPAIQGQPLYLPGVSEVPEMYTPHGFDLVPTPNGPTTPGLSYTDNRSSWKLAASMITRGRGP